jgi:hypothetical protein
MRHSRPVNHSSPTDWEETTPAKAVIGGGRRRRSTVLRRCENKPRSMRGPRLKSLQPRSLRAGRKIGSTPEIAGLITNNARQINRLRSRPPAPSGTVLREAGRPLRERAGRESLDMTAAELYYYHNLSYCRYRRYVIEDKRLRSRSVAIIDITGRQCKGTRIWRTTSTITRWAPAARRCTPVSERAVRQSRGRSKKKLHALLADAPNEQVSVTVDGERRKITKREAVVHQLVNKSATADLRATKMLFDMIEEVEQKARVTSPVLEPRWLDAAHKEVVQHLVDRIRRQILAEMAAESIEAADAECPADNEPKTKPLSAL